MLQSMGSKESDTTERLNNNNNAFDSQRKGDMIPSVFLGTLHVKLYIQTLRFL